VVPFSFVSFLLGSKRKENDKHSMLKFEALVLTTVSKEGSNFLS
jgi:hypothetical protein